MIRRDGRKWWEEVVGGSGERTWWEGVVGGSRGMTTQKPTCLSLPLLALSFFICTANSFSASASLIFLGATTLITRSYTSIALTHLHRPSHAFEAFFTIDGSKSELGMNLCVVVVVSKLNCC